MTFHSQALQLSLEDAHFEIKNLSITLRGETTHFTSLKGERTNTIVIVGVSAANRADAS